MDNSSSQSFSDMLNPHITPEAPNPNTQQQYPNLNSHITPEAPNPNTQQYPNFQTFHHHQQYRMNYPTTNLHGPYPQNIMNPFGGPPNFQHFTFPPPAYHGGYHGNGPASPIGSMPFFGPSGGSNSRGDESSPIASSSPASRMHPMESTPVQHQEDSESSTDDGEKQAGRKLWCEQENLRLVSAWLKNSNDPIDGNGKPRDRFWKEIADQYNKTAPKQQRRTTIQLKEHWHKNMPHINKFNGVYNDVKNRNASGQSDDQLMEEVRAKWKGLMKKKRPFPLEHWWAALKDQPKWQRAYPAHEVQKRVKLN
jgi:hypothetical protein